MSESYFAQVAREWDELQSRMYSDAVRDVALSKAGLCPTAIVADIGAGTGFITRGLASRVARVYAVDQSPEMLDVARKDLATFANIEYLAADGVAIPLPDGCVDAVLANMYLHHVSRPSVAIQEMARVLRPMGRLVFTDLEEHSYAWLREEHHDVWLGFRPDQVRAWLEDARLIDVVIERTGERCKTTSQDRPDQASIGIFVASGTRPELGGLASGRLPVTSFGNTSSHGPRSPGGGGEHG